MVAMYSVFGRQVGSHWLSIATLATVFTGIGIATSGGSKAKPATPPINASSSDEESFIKKFLEEADTKPKH